MKISVHKTETMKVSRTPGTLNININNTNLKQVKDFKYLDSIFAEDDGMNREIENRIQKANNVSYQLAPLLKHTDIPVETKSKIINSIFVPTLTYQCPTWTMTKPLERKTTTSELRCLRKAVNKRHDSQHQNQRNGGNKEHSPSYSTSGDQMVWTSHTTANTPPSSTCIQHKIQ